MKLESGKFYRTKDGRKVGPLAQGRKLGLWVAGTPAGVAAAEWGYNAQGRWGQLSGNCPDDERDPDEIARDIVSEWDEIVWGEWGPYVDQSADFMLRSIGGKLEYRYPVKREPVVETVRLLTGKAYGWLAEPEGNCGEQNTHRITLTIIDGVVQPTATVEAL